MSSPHVKRESVTNNELQQSTNVHLDFFFFCHDNLLVQGDEAPKTVMLGRPGNNVKVGIVGVPNVGKSSFFNILGKMNVPAENFPFCTIDPNVAIVPVPDQRFKWLVKKYKPASEVPPNMTITDIAGLVKVD